MQIMKLSLAWVWRERRRERRDDGRPRSRKKGEVRREERSMRSPYRRWAGERQMLPLVLLVWFWKDKGVERERRRA